MTGKTEFDPVERPRHYVESAVTIEPIELLRHAPFDLGCALKYLIRYDKKCNAKQDLKKALWYLDRVEESCLYNRKPYLKFFREHFSLLSAFIPRMNVADHLTVWFCLEELRNYAEEALENLEDTENAA